MVRLSLAPVRVTRGLCLAASVTAALAVAGPSSTAQAQAPSGELRRPLLELEDYSTLRAAWADVQSDLKRKAWTEAAGQLHHLADIKTDLGLPNAFPLSAALLRAAHEANEDGASDAAASLASTAAALSPEMAPAKLEEAAIAFEATPFGVGDQLRALRGGVERLPTDLPASFGYLANTLSAVTWILIVLVLAYAAAMVLRYRRVWINDLRRLLPRGVTHTQAMLVLGTALVAPLLAGLGLLVAAALWLVGSSLYQRASERVATMVLLALIGGLPLATGQLIAAMSYAGSPQAVLYRCNHSMCSREDRNALRRWLDDEALRPAAAFTLALVSKRREGSGRGAFSEAKRMARTAYAHGETPQTDVLLGNLSYGEALEHCPGVRDEDTTSVVRFEKKLEAALEHWRLALEAAPTEVAALYNSSVVLRQLGNDDEADRLLEQATSVSPEEVTRYGRDVAKDNNRVRCQRAAIVNRHLMDPTLPTAGMRADVMAANVPRDGLVLTFAGLFTGRLGVRAVGMIGYAAAGLTLLLWLLGSLMSLSRSCTKCHDIADPSNRLDLGTRAVCGDCLLADVNRGIGDAKEQWARDQKIHAETLRRGRTPRILTWFLPGFGHLLRGAPVRGLLILALVFGCLLVGSGLNAVVHDPRQPLGVGSGRLFLFGAIAAVTYLLALIDAHTAKVT